MSVDEKRRTLERKWRETGDPDDRQRYRDDCERAGEVVKVFIIMTIDWEYNDNYYYTHENDPGRPHQVYRNEETAKRVCREENLSQARGWDGMNNLHDDNWQQDQWNEIPDDVKKRLGLPEHYDYAFEVDGRNASDEDLEAYMAAMGIQFYEVVEQEVVDV